jgi:xylitol oxidase
LEPYHAKPHWGKLFTMAPARLASLYPRMNDFKKLVAGYDPQGKFRNAFLQRNLYGG